MFVRTISLAASAGLAAGLLALAAAGPAAAATPAGSRVRPATTQLFSAAGVDPTTAIAGAEGLAMLAGFTASECTVKSTIFINSEDWIATVSCTD